MSARLEGKVAIVTGAGSGIGEATAELFHREGACVVAVDRTGDEERLAKRLGEGCVAVHADVSRSTDVQGMVAAALSSFGRLDVLYNNAGIGGGFAPTGEYDEGIFDKVYAVNVRGVFLGMHYGIPAMLENGGGSIISTASAGALTSFPGMAAYCASKAAVVMLTKTAAAEYGSQGIRVNAICPGVTDTRMGRATPDGFLREITGRTPLARMADPSEIAAAALWLAGDESSFVTGAALVVDGGYTAL